MNASYKDHFAVNGGLTATHRLACLSFLDQHGYTALGPHLSLRIQPQSSCSEFSDASDMKDDVEDPESAVLVVSKTCLPISHYAFANPFIRYVAGSFDQIHSLLGTGTSSYVGLLTASLSALHCLAVPFEAVAAGIDRLKHLLQKVIQDIRIDFPQDYVRGVAAAAPHQLDQLAIADQLDNVDWFFEDAPSVPPDPLQTAPADPVDPAVLSEWSDLWLAKGLQHCLHGHWGESFHPADMKSARAFGALLPYPEEICSVHRIALPMQLSLNTAVLTWGKDDFGRFYNSERPRAVDSRYLRNAHSWYQECKDSHRGATACFVVRSSGCSADWPSVVLPDTMPLLWSSRAWSIFVNAHNMQPTENLLPRPGHRRQYILKNCYCIRVSNFGSERDGFKWQLGYEASENSREVEHSYFTTNVSSLINIPLDRCTELMLNSMTPGGVIICAGVMPSDVVYDTCASRGLALVHVSHTHLMLLSYALGIAILDDVSSVAEFADTTASNKYRLKISDNRVNITLEHAPTALHTRVSTHWDGSTTSDIDNYYEQRISSEDNYSITFAKLVIYARLLRMDEERDERVGSILTVHISARTSILCDAIFDRFKRCLSRLRLCIFDVEDEFSTNQIAKCGGVVLGGGVLEAILWGRVEQMIEDITTIDYNSSAIGIPGSKAVSRYLTSLGCIAARCCDHRDVIEVLRAFQRALMMYISNIYSKTNEDTACVVECRTRHMLEMYSGHDFIDIANSSEVLDVAPVVEGVYNNVLFCLQQILCSV